MHCYTRMKRREIDRCRIESGPTTSQTKVEAVTQTLRHLIRPRARRNMAQSKKGAEKEVETTEKEVEAAS